MNRKLLHIINEYWSQRYRMVYFNPDRTIEYWGYSANQYRPYSSMMLRLFVSDFYGSDGRLLHNIVNGVNRTSDCVRSGGAFVTFNGHSDIIGRNGYYKAMIVFKELEILIPVGFNYYIFNEKFIYKIKNSVRLKY